MYPENHHIRLLLNMQSVPQHTCVIVLKCINASVQRDLITRTKEKTESLSYNKINY